MAVSNVVSPSLKGGGRSRLGPPLNPPLYLFNRFCGYSVNAVNNTHQTIFVEVGYLIEMVEGSLAPKHIGLFLNYILPSRV